MSRVPIDELKLTPEFLQLTEKQQKFVSEYILNGGDAPAAVATCYNTNSGNSARSLSYIVLNSPAVQLVLSVHYGDSPTDSFLKELRRMILRGKIPPERLDAMKLYAEVGGFRRSRFAVRSHKDKKADSNTPAPSGGLLDEYK